MSTQHRCNYTRPQILNLAVKAHLNRSPNVGYCAISNRCGNRAASVSGGFFRRCVCARACVSEWCLLTQWRSKVTWSELLIQKLTHLELGSLVLVLLLLFSFWPFLRPHMWMYFLRGWHLSADAKDFLNLCFKRQPKERPNALALARHKFITTDVPSATTSLESKSEQITASSDHAHDEKTNTKDKLKLNLDTQTDTKDLEPTKHRFTGSVIERYSLVFSVMSPVPKLHTCPSFQ